MSWTTDIEEWANWTAEQLQGEVRIPSPRYWRRGEVPWFNDFLSLVGENGPPADLRHAFQHHIRGEQAFAARFVGLDLYHRLAHQDAYPLTDELVEDARQAAVDQFRRLVETLPVSDVLPDRWHLDWELRLCCPLHMWERADALLDKLSDVMPSPEAQTIRAQHLFLRRYWVAEGEGRVDAEFEDELWEAVVVARTSVIPVAILALRAMAFEMPVSTESPPAPEVVCAAVEAGNWPDAAWWKPLLEARPLFELGLHVDVIDRLTTLLDDPSMPPKFKEVVYKVLDKAHERHRDAPSRRAFLQRWSFEFPDDHEVTLKLAAAAADSADYENAYRFLKRAAAQNPQLESDIGTRVGLALGNIASGRDSDWAAVHAVIFENPEVRAIEAVLHAYWEAFGSLEQIERQEWLTGLYVLRIMAPRTEPLAEPLVRQAGLAFLTVAERRLRRGVFARMRRDAQNDRTLRHAASSVPKWERAYLFGRYLSGESGFVSLVEMSRIIDDASWGRFAGPLGELLSKHLSGSHLFERRGAVSELARPRNRAVHDLAAVDAEALHDNARTVIDAVHAMNPIVKRG